MLQIPADNDTSPRPSSRQVARETPTPPDTDEEIIEKETEEYKKLINHGGRPLYPIDLIEKIAEDPKAYRAMLRPWVDVNPYSGYFRWFTIFREQWVWWKSFRYWQKFHRKDFSNKDEDLALLFKYRNFVRAFQLLDGGLPEYAEAVKKLIAQYGFTRPFQFQFQEDPTQQDKLTTWIEYLGFECWISESYTRFLKHKQPEYDEAWKKLVDSNVLRPFETEEYICDILSAFQRQREREQAQKAVESVKSAGNAVLVSVYKDIDNPRGPRLTSRECVRMMLAAKSRLDEAKKLLETIKKRNDLVTEFSRATGKYRIAKEDSERRRPRLRWILDQVPLIEAESNEPSAAETGSNAARGTKRRLERDQDDDSIQDRSVKKRKRNSGKPSSPSDRDTGCQGERLRHTRDNPVNDAPPFKRLRNGGEDLSSHETSDGADTELLEDLKEARNLGEEVGKLDEHAKAKMIQRSGLKASKPSNSRLRKKGPKNAPQSSAGYQPLRRSARIAARQKVSKTVVIPS